MPNTQPQALRAKFWRKISNSNSIVWTYICVYLQEIKTMGNTNTEYRSCKYYVPHYVKSSEVVPNRDCAKFERKWRREWNLSKETPGISIQNTYKMTKAMLRMPNLKCAIWTDVSRKNVTMMMLKGVKEGGREVKGSEADFQFQPKRFPGIVKLIHPTICSFSLLMLNLSRTFITEIGFSMYEQIRWQFSYSSLKTILHSNLLVPGIHHPRMES